MKQTTVCRYCEQEFSFNELINTSRLELVCAQCDYVNVVDNLAIPPIPVPHQATTSLSLNPGSRTDDPQTITALLRGMASQILREAVERIRGEYPTAQNALISLMARRERLLQEKIQNFYRSGVRYDRMFNRVVDLLFTILSLTGANGYCGRPSRDTEGVARFLSWFVPLAEEAVTMATFAGQVRRGELEAVLDSGTLRITKTERHRQAIEWQINRLRKEARSAHNGKGFDMHALRAQQLALGFDATGLFDLTKDECRALRAHAQIETLRGVTLIDIPRSNQLIFKMLDLCSLTSERLKTFRAPFFFDTGKAVPEPLSEEASILEAIAHNWSYYYPFFSFSRPQDSVLSIATTPGVLVGFFSNLHSQTNSVIDHFVRNANEKKDEKLRDKLNRIGADISNALEEEACAIARASGWSAAQGPNSLPCGDIPALFAKVNVDEILLVLAEMKGADFTVHRPDTYEVQSSVVDKAAKQLRAKAAWVANNWNRGFAKNMFGDRIGGITKGKIVKVLITRERQPLTFIRDAECLVVDELPRFLRSFHQGIPTWFSAARRLSTIDFGLVD